MNYKLNGKFKTEAKFTSVFLKAFRDAGNWAYKLPDIGRTIKPFDFFGICKYGLIVCEVKLIKNETFNFRQLRDNQFTALKRIFLLAEKFGLQKFIHPIIMVYSEKQNQYHILKFSDFLEKEKNGEKNIKFILHGIS